MAEVHDLAPHDCHVALHGPRGSGKSRLARYIHAISRRKSGWFEAFALSDAQETLAGSRLFGHERGAFTGAERRTRGCFELAKGGTLLLDELGKASLAVQRQLLEVLEFRTVQRLGAERPILVDARVIFAYNEDVPALIAEREFLPDLYDRFNSFVIEVPALSERRADLPALIEFGVARAARKLAVPAPVISQDLMHFLAHADWPGNLRQLATATERLVVNARGGSELSLEHAGEVPTLRDQIRRRPASDYSLEELEREIRGSSVTSAAKKLGVDRKTIYRLRERKSTK